MNEQGKPFKYVPKVDKESAFPLVDIPTPKKVAPKKKEEFKVEWPKVEKKKNWKSMEDEAKEKEEEKEAIKEAKLKEYEKNLPPCPKCATKQKVEEEKTIPVIKSTSSPPEWAIHPSSDYLKDHLPGKAAMDAAGLPYKDPEAPARGLSSDGEPIITSPNQSLPPELNPSAA